MARTRGYIRYDKDLIRESPETAGICKCNNPAIDDGTCVWCGKDTAESRMVRPQIPSRKDNRSAVLCQKPAGTARKIGKARTL